MVLLTSRNYASEDRHDVAYWVLAALLGAFYLFAGGKKLARARSSSRP